MDELVKAKLEYLVRVRAEMQKRFEEIQKTYNEQRLALEATISTLEDLLKQAESLQ